MRTEQIYYALMVAKCGSFSKAAELLYIKQQSVRAAINHLEDELGVTLFARTQKGVSLTDQGQETLRKLQDMLDIYEGIKYTSNELKNREKILVGVNSFGLSLVSQTLDIFYIKYPQISIQITEENSPLNLIAELLERRYDFVATSIAANIFEKSAMIKDNIASQTLIFEKWMTFEMGCFLKSTHPLAARSSLTIEDLEQYLLVFPYEQIYTTYLSEIYNFGQTPNMVISSNEMVNNSYIKNFQGILVAPSSLDLFQDPTIDIVNVPLEDSKPLYLGFFYLADSKNLASIKNIINFAERYNCL